MKNILSIKKNIENYLKKNSQAPFVLVTSLDTACFSTSGGCNFENLMTFVNTLVSFLLYLSTLIATVLFVYAGATYIFAAGDSGKISKAHGIFTSTAIGLIVTFGAWLIVETILTKLGVKGAFNLLGN